MVPAVSHCVIDSHFSLAESVCFEKNAVNGLGETLTTTFSQNIYVKILKKNDRFLQQGNILFESFS